MTASSSMDLRDLMDQEAGWNWAVSNICSRKSRSVVPTLERGSSITPGCVKTDSREPALAFLIQFVWGGAGGHTSGTNSQMMLKLLMWGRGLGTHGSGVPGWWLCGHQDIRKGERSWVTASESPPSAYINTALVFPASTSESPWNLTLHKSFATSVLKWKSLLKLKEPKIGLILIFHSMAFHFAL